MKTCLLVLLLVGCERDTSPGSSQTQSSAPSEPVKAQVVSANSILAVVPSERISAPIGWAGDFVFPKGASMLTEQWVEFSPGHGQVCRRAEYSNSVYELVDMLKATHDPVTIRPVSEGLIEANAGGYLATVRQNGVGSSVEVCEDSSSSKWESWLPPRNDVSQVASLLRKVGHLTTTEYTVESDGATVRLHAEVGPVDQPGFKAELAGRNIRIYGLEEYLPYDEQQLSIAILEDTRVDPSSFFFKIRVSPAEIEMRALSKN